MIPSSRFRVRNDIEVSTRGRTDGNTTAYEQQVLASLMRYLEPASILEIGTFNGLSTYNMAKNAPGARIITVDLPRELLGKTKLPLVIRKKAYDDKRYIQKETSGALFLGAPESQRITQFYCDSALLGQRIRRSFDFIFIDGSHSYEYTRNDTRYALRHLAPEGTVLWHDYGKRCWPGVSRALDELHESGVPLHRIPKTSFVMFRREE